MYVRRLSGIKSSIQSERDVACAAVNSGSTSTASLAVWISVAVVGDQSGVMLSGIGNGGTAGMGGATKTSARSSEEDIVNLAILFLMLGFRGFSK